MTQWTHRLGLDLWAEFDWSWVPGLSGLMGLSDQAQGADTMACALSMGLPAPQTLDLAAKTCSTRRYRRAFADLSGQCSRGSGLADALDSKPALFAAPLRWALRQGEQQDQPASALTACSEYLDEEYRRQ